MSILIVCIYVDDLIFTGNSEVQIMSFKESMKKEFEMTDLGLMHYFLGIQVSQSEHEVTLSQGKYAQDLLKRFNMANSAELSTPAEYGITAHKDTTGQDVEANIFRSLVGSLMYLCATRPDITYSVSLISKYMEKPKRSHWEMAKRILRYIKGTLNQGLIYKRNETFMLQGYCDSNYGGDPDDGRSTGGYMFKMGDSIISWQSKKQNVVALSSTEAEYMALCAAGCQALWLRGILDQLLQKQMKSCPRDQEADILTKALQVGRFRELKIKAGVGNV
ncbi:hypothetical protein QVD17_30343 [Tagetes erecta]|uniref:Reverse transcriptase Ty1/copia-type domain-containing protein n=1 Tax=Tagetes erecta TaxID=13708 RepID=A0AAD8K576_TARER|nr:hypothetical protein QVD17_30343 [Tagetes erecta]